MCLQKFLHEDVQSLFCFVRLGVLTFWRLDCKNKWRRTRNKKQAARSKKHKAFIPKVAKQSRAQTGKNTRNKKKKQEEEKRDERKNELTKTEWSTTAWIQTNLTRGRAAGGGNTGEGNERRNTGRRERMERKMWTGEDHEETQDQNQEHDRPLYF